ncbi:MAG TPA: aminopeptidase N [Frankiaceae bacterium]|jgi:aminopeptidase N|nr:aminopeptidase N [Frankiaceae bacterium]
MSAQNLTRDEARARAAIIRDASYDVELDLTSSEVTFTSTTTARFGCTEPGAETFVDLIAPSVQSITLNGAAVDPATAFDGDRIHLTGLAAENELVVVADCAYMHTGVGLHRFVDPVDKQVYLYTQFETFDAHRVYACFDQPDVKARFTLSCLAPANWVVVSNMATTEEPDRTEGGWWRFGTSPLMSPYITAIVAGPYHSVTDEHKGIPLGIYCRESLAEFLDPDEIFTLTKQGFDWFQENFDYPYPFGKYDQLFVPEFNAGAMENAGAVTFLEDYVFRSKVTDAARERRAETILHEMAHMWFGDLVTMRWWDDLWLNESFATYASVLCQVSATRFTGGWTTFANVEKTWAYKQDQMPSTHPVVADIVDIEAVEVNFDGITYAKGASVLKQLVAWVGQDRFLGALRSYFKKHEYGNTELKDLLAELETSSGRDLSSWSKEWLETAGVNTLRAVFETDDAGAFTSFAVHQEAPPDWPTLRSHRIAIGLYSTVDGRLERTDRVELDVVGSVTEVPELVGRAQPDLVLVNDDDLSYCKIRLDARSLETLTSSLGTLSESLPRTLCWAAAWDMTRDAELPARDYLRLVLRNIGTETEVGVVQTLIAQSTGAIVNFGDPANREAGYDLLASAAWEHMHSAEAGSGHQLAWTRAFASSARGEHVDKVLGLLNGTVEVPGLVVDTELRWHLVRNLAARGAIGEDVIAAEAERDPTAAGARHAVAARAARPTAEAKAEAWASIMDDPKLPNAMLSATMGGFQQADQAELLAPYAQRYFDAIERIWDERTNETAINIITSMFPSVLIDQRTVDATNEYLRTGKPVPAIRRLLVEGRDGLERALRAQAVDVAAGRGEA